MFRKTKFCAFVFGSVVSLCVTVLANVGCEGLQQARTCTPFSQRICACLDGYQGTQQCNEGGDEWSVCRCKDSQIEISTESSPKEEDLTTETSGEMPIEKQTTEIAPEIVGDASVESP